MLNETNVKSNFSKFSEGYRAVRRMEGSPWPTENLEREFCGNISYQKDEKQATERFGLDKSYELKQVTEKLEWNKAYKLAQEKLKGKIINIQIDPKDKGKIAAAIYRSLDVALGKESRKDYAKIHHAQEVLGGMYLFGLTKNKTLLNKMYKGFNLTKEGSLMPANGIVEHTFNELYNEFGLLDKKDGTWNSYKTLRQTIEKILGKEDKESIPTPPFKTIQLEELIPEPPEHDEEGPSESMGDMEISCPPSCETELFEENFPQTEEGLGKYYNPIF